MVGREQLTASVKCTLRVDVGEVSVRHRLMHLVDELRGTDSIKVGISLLLLAIFLQDASAQHSESVFIPFALLSEQALADYKAALIDSGWSQSKAEELVKIPSNVRNRLTDIDFRMAFPEINESDTQASLCTNHMLRGSNIRLVYLSPASDNSVIAKSSRCSRTDDGFLCSSLKLQKAYFFEMPESYFTLKNNVSFDEAEIILSIFRDQGIANFSPVHGMYTYQDVTAIGKTGDLYTLSLGDQICSGCATSIKVKVVDTGDGLSTLRLVEKEQGLCL